MKIVAPFDMPASSPYQALGYGSNQSPWQDTIVAGQEIAIPVHGYKIYDEIPKNEDSMTVSMGQAVYGSWFGTGEEIRFSTGFIEHDRQSGGVNPFEVMKAFNLAAARMTPVVFYPEIDNFPDEYKTMMMLKVLKPKRYQTQQLFSFDFQFIAIPNSQIPANIPSFV